jgi:hypothetical protein
VCLVRSRQTAAGHRQALDPKLRPLFVAQLDELKTLVDGPSSIPRLRQQELDLIADAGRLLAENETLSTQLTDAAEQLVEATKQEVRGASIRPRRYSDALGHAARAAPHSRDPDVTQFPA